VAADDTQLVDEPEIEQLQLADWRRRIAELYAEVRHLSRDDPRSAHARWRAVREQLYRHHPASPLPADKRASFRALYFPYDDALRFEARLIPGTQGEATAPAGPPGPSIGLALPISTGQPRTFDRVGWLDLTFRGGARRLGLFWLSEYSGGLFLAFRDGTNGRETYGGGRYVLDTGKGADLGGDPVASTVVVDFNFSYQPSCAFDPRWSCPLAPPENKLDLAVRAGERIA
jgi:uncharacterized protein (DUF1684 family)